MIEEFHVLRALRGVALTLVIAVSKKVFRCNIPQ